MGDMTVATRAPPLNKDTKNVRSCPLGSNSHQHVLIRNVHIPSPEIFGKQLGKSEKSCYDSNDRSQADSKVGRKGTRGTIGCR